MIQRIQSIYLLVAAILMAVTVFSPLFILHAASAIQGGSISKFGDLFTCTTLGIFNQNGIYPTWGVLTFAAFAALLPLANIFLFKKRKLQMKIANITTLMIILFYITLVVYCYVFMQKNVEVVFDSIQYGIVLPAIALIFNILAVLRIKKDEKLVRSLDRIR